MIIIMCGWVKATIWREKVVDDGDILGVNDTRKCRWVVCSRVSKR